VKTIAQHKERLMNDSRLATVIITTALMLSIFRYNDMHKPVLVVVCVLLSIAAGYACAVCDVYVMLSGIDDNSNKPLT